jgi:hypothetical protein
MLRTPALSPSEILEFPNTLPEFLNFALSLVYADSSSLASIPRKLSALRCCSDDFGIRLAVVTG